MTYLQCIDYDFSYLKLASEMYGKKCFRNREMFWKNKIIYYNYLKKKYFFGK